MAELLVQARGHWMDNFTQAQIDALDDNAKASRDARIQLGDIVVVRPDGWQWGNEENLPRYIIVKIPQLSVDDVSYLVEQLIDKTNPDKPIILKKRKWKVPNVYMQQALLSGKSEITITLSQQKLNFINNLIEKTS
jgi:hypothetical protein